MTAITPPKQAEQQGAPLQSSTALWIGILFSFAFTALIWLVRPLLPQIDFLPDTGAAWYYWQLPNPTAITRASVWGGYLLHQVFMWWTIYQAQNGNLKYSNGLHRINVIALLGNALFIVLHLVQTAVWYDGLAQDVSIFSSQGSVILMLVMILLMENQRRGLFFGYKIGFLKETGRVARKYHGYIFAWAIIYTFWYHPMENTAGHLVGFAYTFLLLLQGSLMYTRMHLNKYWAVVSEVAVLFHGTMVAWLQGNGIWPMFFFGFAGIFVVTQMYGLGLKTWQRWAFLAAYAAGVVGIYIFGGRGFGKIQEISYIPFIEYLLVFVLAGIIWLIMKGVGLAGGRVQANLSAPD